MNPGEVGDRDEPSLLRVQPKPHREKRMKVTEMNQLERQEDQKKRVDTTAKTMTLFSTSCL